ncbi:MAG: TIM barrel protein [Phycisphaera sp.]|nr:TIM barrel protein [Phycisphaera sp.]
MPAIPIALQLYSLHEQCKKDMPAALRRVAEMGYHGVEFAGYGDRDAIDVRQMLYDSGLRCAGAHIKIEHLEGPELYQTVEFSLALGNSYLVVPWLPPERRDYVAFSEQLNFLAAELSRFRLRIGYHSHDFDFVPGEGGKPSGWQTLIERCDPSVILQLDTANALSVGVDPLPLLDTAGRRTTTIHLKEWSGQHGTIIGAGEVAWEEVFRRCKANGTLWYIVEHEPTEGEDAFDRVSQDMEGLIARLGADGLKRQDPPVC